MSNESSLTAPEDRDKSKRYLPNQHASPLTDTETNLAMASLNITDFVEKFPKVERVYADPFPPLQKYGLLSFVPAKGAIPNEKGIYGFAKLRGNYDTEIEAQQRAEFLIKHVDSYHPIFHTYVGRPFPITNDPRYVKETDEIDIRSETTKSISNSVK